MRASRADTLSQHRRPSFPSANEPPDGTASSKRAAEGASVVALSPPDGVFTESPAARPEMRPSSRTNPQFTAARHGPCFQKPSLEDVAGPGPVERGAVTSTRWRLRCVVCHHSFNPRYSRRPRGYSTIHMITAEASTCPRSLPTSYRLLPNTQTTNAHVAGRCPCRPPAESTVLNRKS